MAIAKFEDAKVWQKSQDMAVDIYLIFQKSKDFGFKDQITRSAVSISNNIAEGFDRSSNKEFCRFLFYASASNSEVKSMIYLAHRLAYISAIEKETMLDKSNEIARMIRGLIKSMQ